MTVYVSGALKGSRNLKKARALYERAAAAIKSAGHEAYLPHTVSDPKIHGEMDEITVYRTDLRALRNASAVIAFLNEPSLGVGAEIAICGSENIPILGLCLANTDISRFAVGCLLDGGGKLLYYSNDSHLNQQIVNFVQEIN